MDINKDDGEWILQLIDSYMNEHFEILSNPDFEEILMNDLKKICGIMDEDDSDTEDESIIEHHTMDDPLYECLYLYYMYFMPRRSFDTTFIYKLPNILEISCKLDVLRSKPQPIQRTLEWYEYRQNVITASNLYKIFGSRALQNELIYEKCKTVSFPNQGIEDSVNKNGVNTTSSLHWGVKYEPVSIMVYEDLYSTQIESMGCITHDTYSFIGASPDGVNSKSSSMMYGRLIEIKNVKSREIDGTICEQYWIQMQIQMEVCNINECDFLETKFIEYESYNDYLMDNEADSDNIEYDYVGYPSLFYKGFFIYFHKDSEGPKYIYKPLNIKTLEEEILWETKIIEEYENNGYQWITNIYWKLVTFNCQLILRNKFWFSKAVPYISRFWDTIQYDRVHGSDHRKPASRVKKTDLF
jgi:putative phage-type endonuclease